MILYTRLLLCTKLHISNPTLRRILRTLSVLPYDIIFNSRNCPVYMYTQLALDSICAAILDARLLKASRKARGIRCRGGCNKYYPELLLNKSQVCKSCRNNKALLNIAYDKKPWLKVLDAPAVQAAIDFMQNLLKKVEKTLKNDLTN